MRKYKIKRYTIVFFKVKMTNKISEITYIYLYLLVYQNKLK